MKQLVINSIVLGLICLTVSTVFAQKPEDEENKPKFDAELAKKLGANEYGMRSYVFVLLKTGSKTIEDAKERSEIFAGHFANMNKLA